MPLERVRALRLPTPRHNAHQRARTVCALPTPISLPPGQASVDLLPLDSNWRTDLPRSGVGLSFSAGFPALAKAIVVLIMLYGRTRSLPQVLSFPDILITHIPGYAYMLMMAGASPDSSAHPSPYRHTLSRPILTVSMNPVARSAWTTRSPWPSRSRSRTSHPLSC